MEYFILRAIELILFILPAYVANASPVPLGGGTPIDFGRKFIDGRRIFGDGKTIRGSVLGVLCGIIASFAVSFYDPLFLTTGLILSFLTIFGDILGSFIKRRLGAKRGEKFEIVDRLFFFIVSVPPAMIFYPLSLSEFLFLLLLTFVLHAFANFAAYELKIKKVPW